MGYELSPESSRVLQALEDPRYRWRTASGISRDTGISVDRVYDVINSPIFADSVIRAARPAKDGQPLFTTRAHYKRKQGFGTRLLGALSDRVAG